MSCKLLYWAFTCLQTVYSPDLSNLLFHFIALSLSFRFIILLAACPRHADTILSLKLFLSPSSPFFPSLPIAVLPSRPHSIPPSYVLPNSSAWNYILSSSITCAFITSLRVGMSVASLDGELPGAGLLCLPYKAMCFTHARHDADVCCTAWRAVSQIRPGDLVFWDSGEVPPCASADSDTPSHPSSVFASSQCS